MAPSLPQILLLYVAVILFAGGTVVSLSRVWAESPGRRRWARGLGHLGLGITLAVLVWHGIARRSWRPIGDNFDALLWLGILLALFMEYVQRTRPLGGLEWFVLPIVVALLVGAAIFGSEKYRTYGGSAWQTTHLATSYAGAAAFAVAAACGAMYMTAARKLRRKGPPGPNLGSLERLERLTMTAVTLGFALLTVGLIVGFVRTTETRHAPWPKVVLGSLAWLIYAIVLHAPINPRFRGRRAAMLSIFGFVLMVLTLVVVQLMPGVKA